MIIYSPQRSDDKLEYEINDNIINVKLNGNHYKTYDTTKEIEHDDLTPIRVEGEKVILLRFYGDDEKHLYERG